MPIDHGATLCVVAGLRELADRVQKNGLRSASISSYLEVIEVPTDGEWREHRPGPACVIRIVLDWANIEPADTEAGEVSKGWESG